MSKIYEYPVTATIEMTDNDFSDFYEDIWDKLDDYVSDHNPLYREVRACEADDVLTKVMADFLEYAKKRLTNS